MKKTSKEILKPEFRKNPTQILKFSIEALTAAEQEVIMFKREIEKLKKENRNLLKKVESLEKSLEE